MPDPAAMPAGDIHAGRDAANPRLSERLIRQIPLALALGSLIFGWLWLNLEGVYFRDALAYWRPDFADLYGGRQVGVLSTYLYSPAFAQLMWPLGLLPWPVFAALWSGFNLFVLARMVGPYVGAVLLLFPGSPVGSEISTGNVHLLIAAAIVIGFRRPVALAFTVITKITPGVAILWFLGARRWAPLAAAAATTILISAISFVTLPSAWLEWFDTLRRSAEVAHGSTAVIPGPLWLRAGVAAGLAIAAGATGIRWLAPVAAMIALPVPWYSGLSLLVGALALTRERWETVPQHAWRNVSTWVCVRRRVGR